VRAFLFFGGGERARSSRRRATRRAGGNFEGSAQALDGGDGTGCRQAVLHLELRQVRSVIGRDPRL